MNAHVSAALTTARPTRCARRRTPAPKAGGAAPLLAAAVLAWLSCGCRPAARQPQAGPARAAETTSAGPVTLTVEVAPARGHIGDLLHYTYRIEHPSQLRLVPPAFPDSIAPFVVRDFTPPRTRRLGSASTAVEGGYLLDTFEVGKLEIPPLPIQYVDPTGATQTVHTAALPVEIVSLLATQAELPDILEVKPLAEPPPLPAGRRLWWIAGGFLGLLALVALGFWIRARRRVAPPVGPLTPPPHVRALAALYQLRRASIADRDAIESFYVQTSAIVRLYIEERFGCHAPERTTEEFLAEIEQNPALLGPEWQELLHAFLEESDLVKFARLVPAPERVWTALDRAIAFVEGTQPAQAPAPGQRSDP